MRSNRFPQAEVSMRNDTTVFIGLDVHKDSIAVACVGADAADTPVDAGTIGTQQFAIDRLIKRLAGRGPLKFAGVVGNPRRRYAIAAPCACAPRVRTDPPDGTQ